MDNGVGKIEEYDAVSHQHGKKKDEAYHDRRLPMFLEWFSPNLGKSEPITLSEHLYWSVAMQRMNCGVGMLSAWSRDVFVCDTLYAFIIK
jgi:hypothetical protein